MCQTRLNNLFTLFVSTSETDALDHNTIAKEFVSVDYKLFLEVLKLLLANHYFIGTL